MFQQILPDALVQAGGWTLIHSLWQGALITLLLAFILGRTRQKSPTLRYQLSVGALFLLLGTVVLTFFLYYGPTTSTGFAFEQSAGERSATFSIVAATSEPGHSNFIANMFPLLIQVWFIGVTLMGLRMLGELAYLQRLRSSNTQAVAETWTNRLTQLSYQLDILQKVELKESLRVSSPMLLGWIKPIILLPIGILSSLSPKQVECVLAHELAHVRRMDYLVNLIQSAVEVLLFFNPAVWWISAQIREEREHCCDELAVSLTGDRLTLVKTLAQLEEWRLQNGKLSLAFNGRPQGMLGRVQRLLGAESSVRIIGKGIWSLLFLSMMMGLLAFSNHVQAIPTDSDEANGAFSEEVFEAPLETTDFLQNIAVPEAHTPENQEKTQVKSAGLSQMEEASDWPELDQEAEDQFRFAAAMEFKEDMQPTLDTIPDDNIQREMKVLQKEMHRLQEQMTGSPEMKQIEELSKKYEVEMRAMEEKLMQEQGGYQKMMEEQQKMVEKMERKQQEMMQNGVFKEMEIERKKLEAVFAIQEEALKRQFGNNPQLEGKLDSLWHTFDEANEIFEEKYEKVMKGFEEQMEAFEDAPEFKELEQKMGAMEKEMEKIMEARLEPLEKEMEKLEALLDGKFEGQMKALEEKMEKLEYLRLKKKYGEREE